MKKSNYQPGFARLMKVLLYAAIIFLAFYISNNHFQLMLIQGNSMMPTYRHMQIVVLDKHCDTYRAGDVIAFQCDGLSSVVVKRIVAIPGETVVIQDETLFVDQQASSLYDRGAFSSPGILGEELCLDECEYIVIGDNLDESKDSRDASVGIVHIDDIIGRVLTGSEN